MATEFLAIAAFIMALAIGGVYLLFLARRPNRLMAWENREAMITEPGEYTHTLDL